jgi:hypothetical protein
MLLQSTGFTTQILPNLKDYKKGKGKIVNYSLPFTRAGARITFSLTALSTTNLGLLFGTRIEEDKTLSACSLRSLRFECLVFFDREVEYQNVEVVNSVVRSTETLASFCGRMTEIHQPR